MRWRPLYRGPECHRPSQHRPAGSMAVEVSWSTAAATERAAVGPVGGGSRVGKNAARQHRRSPQGVPLWQYGSAQRG